MGKKITWWPLGYKQIKTSCLTHLPHPEDAAANVQKGIWAGGFLCNPSLLPRTAAALGGRSTNRRLPFIRALFISEAAVSLRGPEVSALHISRCEMRRGRKMKLQKQRKLVKWQTAPESDSDSSIKPHYLRRGGHVVTLSVCCSLCFSHQENAKTTSGVSPEGWRTDGPRTNPT